ncbi:MAG TPA: hypothetical protein VFG24_09350 [Nitrosopumilaceae archaeon]|nr:hypothetical protein [Nitrosopumilaceae archaeon]
MTQSGQQNHYNVKFLKGYGFSIKVPTRDQSITPTDLSIKLTRV